MSVPDHFINFAYTISVAFIGQIKIGIFKIMGIFKKGQKVRIFYSL